MEPINIPTISERQIAGAGFFGGLFGGGASSSGGTEQPNTARSKSIANLLFLVGQGKLSPFERDADFRNQILFDGVRLRNDDGTFNFRQVEIDWRSGTPDQSPIPRTTRGVFNPQSVAVQISRNAGAVTRTVSNPSATQARVTLYVPEFRKSDNSGNTTGTRVEFKISTSTNGGAYIDRVYDAFDFKTASLYARDYTFPIARGATTSIRVERITNDATSQLVRDALFWQSYTTVVERSLRYPNWALLFMRVDSSYFARQPKVQIKTKNLVIDCNTIISAWVDNENVPVDFVPPENDLRIFTA